MNLDERTQLHVTAPLLPMMKFFARNGICLGHYSFYWHNHYPKRFQRMHTSNSSFPSNVSFSYFSQLFTSQYRANDKELWNSQKNEVHQNSQQIWSSLGLNLYRLCPTPIFQKEIFHSIMFHLYINCVNDTILK